jgi:thioredoxin-dependent peroxiredoxin
LSAFRDDLTSFQELDAEVFGVNSGSEKSHQKFSAKYSFNFPLLVDREGEVTEKYAARRDLVGGTVRTVYIVSKDGAIQYAQRGSPTDEELLGRLRQLNLPK